MVAALLLAPAIAAAGPGGSPAPEAEFAGPAIISTNEGHATLTWEVGDAASDRLAFELQRSRRADFSNHTVHYQGPHRALFVSGLEDGPTWFRVRAVPEGGAPGAWSEPLTVEVAYPPVGRVIVLLTVGLLVFLATVGAIVAGWRRTREAGAS